MPNPHDTLNLQGTLSFVSTSGDSFDGKNLIVDAGKLAVANWLAGAVLYMGVGSGGTPAMPANTALESQLARVAVTVTQTSTSLVFTGNFGAGTATGTWQEAGLFTAATGGTLFSRIVFTPREKTASDTITANWTVSVS